MNSNSNRFENKEYPLQLVVSIKSEEMNTCHQEMPEITEGAPLQNISASSIDASGIPQDNENQFVGGGSKNIDDQTNTHHQNQIPEYFLPQFKNLTSLDEYRTQMDGRLNGADRHLLETSQNFDDQAEGYYDQMHEYDPNQQQNTYYNPSNDEYYPMQSDNTPLDNQDQDWVCSVPNESSEFYDDEDTRNRKFQRKCMFPVKAIPVELIFTTRKEAEKRIFQKFLEPFKFKRGETAEIIRGRPLRDNDGIMNTRNVSRRFLYELYLKRCTTFNFFEKVIGATGTLQRYFADTIRAPPPYQMLKVGGRGHVWFEKIYKWLMLCGNDKMAVLEGRETRCCPFELKKIDSNSDCTSNNQKSSSDIKKSPSDWFMESYKFEAGETPETIQALPLRDKYGMIDTRNVSKKLLYELHIRKSTKSDIIRRLIETTFNIRHYYNHLIEHPPPYNKMRMGKGLFHQICEWLMLCENDKKAVLEGRETRCCHFEVMKIDYSNSDYTGYEENPPYLEYVPPQNKYYDTSLDQYFD